jgi:glycosyltransferase involved in cell wall biosynthesis
MYMAGWVWLQPSAIQFMQWLPVYAILIYEVTKAIKHRSKKLILTQPQSISIIIPVLNAAEHIDECLRNANGLDPCPLEIIVVDGGSIDNTVEIAHKHNVRVIKSSSGRGRQIWCGVEEARGDVTAVLHADTCLEPDSLKRILNSFYEQPYIVGGSVGQRFKDSGFGLSLIEILNDLRAALFGISFGDQVQFFRTQVARRYNLVPRWSLMEDVELSLRLGRFGKRVFLWGGAVVSNYKWQDGFVKRFYKVIYLLTVFFIRKLRGRMDTEDLYDIYYMRELRRQNSEVTVRN